MAGVLCDVLHGFDRNNRRQYNDAISGDCKQCNCIDMPIADMVEGTSMLSLFQKLILFSNNYNNMYLRLF